MINIYIKKMTGDLLTIQYDKEWSAERLHDCVYDILPDDEKPLYNEKWKIMLFLRGEWIVANKQSVDVEEGDILDLLIESGKYKIDFSLEDYIGGLWNIVFKIRGSLNIDCHFHIDQETGLFYFENEVELYDDYYNVKHFSIGHEDAHDLINTFDLSLCVREHAYSQFFLCHRSILSNAPKPISYYSQEDKNLNIQNMINSLY